MKEKTKRLIELQDCDNRMREIIKRQGEGPLKIQRLEEELKASEMKFQEENQRLELLKKDRRRLEKDIEDLESKIEKSHIKLSHIKSNKEYRAALKEIEDLKRGKFQAEDKVIQIMEDIEGLEKRCLESKDNQEGMRKKFEENKDEILKELDVLDRILEDLEERRITFHQTIEPELLKKYLFIKERKRGQAISAVVAGVCQTCHMGIPPQQFNELIRGSSLLTCPNCNRIIYWGEDKHFQDLSPNDRMLEQDK